MSRIGMVLYGYCNGYFGRDSYGPKRIEAEGIDWIVVRDESGQPDFAEFGTARIKTEKLEIWSQPDGRGGIT